MCGVQGGGQTSCCEPRMGWRVPGQRARTAPPSRDTMLFLGRRKHSKLRQWWGLYSAELLSPKGEFILCELSLNKAVIKENKQREQLVASTGEDRLSSPAPGLIEATAARASHTVGSAVPGSALDYSSVVFLETVFHESFLTSVPGPDTASDSLINLKSNEGSTVHTSWEWMGASRKGQEHWQPNQRPR